MVENGQLPSQILFDFLAPSTSSYRSNIVVHEIVATRFKLDPFLINVI